MLLERATFTSAGLSCMIHLANSYANANVNADFVVPIGNK